MTERKYPRYKIERDKRIHRREWPGQPASIVYPVLKFDDVLLTIQTKSMNSVVQRMWQPTPKFFRKLRNIGLTVAAVGASILGSPVALPAVLLKIAGYLVVAGGVAGTVSQATMKNDE